MGEKSQARMTYARRRVQKDVQALQYAGFDISVKWEEELPHKARCQNRSGTEDISPRLQSNQLELWLDGYKTGTRAGYKSAKDRVDMEFEKLSEL